MGSSYRTQRRNDVTAKLVRQMFDYDAITGIFRWRYPTKSARKNGIAGSIKHGRRILSINRKHFFASNIAWLHFYGEWPKLEVGHRNHDPLDNSIANLRDVTGAVNSGNQRKKKSNTSGFIGVYLCRGKCWHARIRANGDRRYNLGMYPTAELAAGAYRIAAAGIHGDA